ncbi:MAG TPA: hypothetical protein VEU74_09545, partial [Gemmatimonadales bacterium]|nr:hypothetical protein [Gemmatimonadales bacterium]
MPRLIVTSFPATSATSPATATFVAVIWPAAATSSGIKLSTARCVASPMIVLPKFALCMSSPPTPAPPPPATPPTSETPERCDSPWPLATPT